MKKLSIIIPVYNEERTIILLLDKINSVPLQYELETEFIVVDDASTDGTAGLVTRYIHDHPHPTIHFLQHKKNTGKGSCIRAGIKKANGHFILIQDADLEYDPNDYNSLLQPLMEDKADVVYGSRFVGGRPHRVLFFWHSLGNRLLTFFSNMLTNLNLTDMENGYKLFRSEIIQPVELEENRFGFEPEITAKLAKLPGIRIYEVGISYYGRTYQEGKKINWKDGCRAVYSIIKYNLFSADKTYQTRTALFSKQIVYLLLSLFFVAGVILLFTASGTGDEGDSVMHYLYARNAYQNPEHFFNHWAKPLYVFIAAPFAQAGMPAMKAFNLACSVLTLYFTFKTAGKLNLANAWLAPFFMALSPWLMIVTLSGLTEPLFALWMIAGIYLVLCKKPVAGILWLSFLPFVRSEGLIILAVLLLYILAKKWFRYIPLLLAGHVFYSVAGYFIHKDLLWVFNKMTYATLSSAYGHGPWLHFVHSLPEVIGKAVCVFLVLGLIYGLVKCTGRFLFRQSNAISNEELFLVYGMFTVYFVGHSAFWALGIFNSFGLLRVLVGVLPLIGIIAARGFNFLAGLSVQFFYKCVLYGLCLLTLVYPFLHDKYSYNWKRDFSLKADQVAEQRMAAYVRQRFPDYKQHLFYFEACFISVALDINIFDSSKRLPLQNFFELPDYPSGSFIVWDDWFGPEQGMVTEEQLSADPRFELVKGFEETDVWNRTRKVRLFRVK